MNYSDSERIAGMMQNIGFKETSEIKKADLVIINTCGVRQMSEDRAYGVIHNLKKVKPKTKVIMTGCLANRKDVQRRMKDRVDLFCEIKDITKEIPKFIKTKEIQHLDYLEIMPKYKTNYSAFIPVMTGCNNFCSYCVVPYARGREVSRKSKEIISEIKSLVKNGYKEITLLGQNVNSYKDEKTNFAKLLKKVNAIPGNFWIRFLSSHPKDMSNELIEIIAKSKKVCEYIHLPIQAGDDKILERMNRKYTSKHYLSLISKIKKAFKKYKPKEIYSINGDIIVGFPGETKKQFLESAKIMKEVGYDMIFFGQFSSRPGTVAAKMKDNISKTEKKRREKFLNEILKKTAFQNNQQYLGKMIEVLIDNEKNDPVKSATDHGANYYFGKTRTMKNVKVVSPEKNLIGKIIKVKITKANIWNLEGICHPTSGSPQDENLEACLTKRQKEKVIVILGPTSSGKSEVAIKLAQKFNGEIISADSRQIYRGMDLGTGKVEPDRTGEIPKEFTKSKFSSGSNLFFSQKILHHMLNIVSPKTDYNVAKYKKETEKIIKDILKRDKLPIICGGTGFWIKAIVDDVNFPEVKPDFKLREQLNKLGTEKLFERLQKLDSERSKSIDAKNKVRLIRAIEICEELGAVPKIKKNRNNNDFLQIGLDLPKEKLHENIKKRLDDRFKKGMVKEVSDLHFKTGVSWKKLDLFGLEYRYISQFLQGKLSKSEMQRKLFQESKNYAKRQMTWFQKDKRIIWIEKNQDIKKSVREFLK